MKIYYGIVDRVIDVTNICLAKLVVNDIMTIPQGDINRANIFTDPLQGKLKSIFIDCNNEGFTAYDDSCIIKINISNNEITTITEKGILNKLNNIHSTLQIKYGGFHDEFPEQKMAVRYLTGKEKVLEIGGNIGRNALVIARILDDDNNLVSLESDVNISKQLIENRDLNKCKFNIEPSALSKRKLIQKGWDTVPNDTLQNGYKHVNTITWDELNAKYNIEFDTLVLDCEGAFYYILIDMPEILNNIKLIIMENDYRDISQKLFVDEILHKNNFKIDYSESGGWGPCKANFFEVWIKN